MRVLRRPGGPIGGACATVLAALLLGGLLPAAAPAARIPVYRDPPAFKGPVRAPAVVPPPTPPAVPLSTSGTFPDVLVDEAGTAHIVWNEGRGDDADVTVYCRLKRGASSCDGPPVQLAWNKAYGEGDGPQFNIDNGGPKIVRIGDQLLVLSQRYPTNSAKPDGTSSSNTVVGWVSADGGQTWSDASILGKYVLGQLGLIGTGDNVSVLNLGEDPLCPGMCVEDYRSGEFAGTAGNLATGPDQAYYPTLATAGGVPTAAWGDLSNQIFLRRWTGAGAVTDPGTWTTSPPVAGEEPSLAAGPGGVQLMSLAAAAKPGQRKPYVVRPVVGDGGTLGAGPATTISTTDNVAFGRLAQDAQGRTIAAWEQREGASPGVRMRVTGGGSGTASAGPAAAPAAPAAPPAAAAARAAVPRAVRAPKLPKLPAVPPIGSDDTFAGAFGPAQTLITGKDNGQIALAATGDGGGFAVLNHTGGVNSPGQIVAAAIGTAAPTNVPGLGKLPGGGSTNKSCETIAFGSFDIKGSTCLYHGTGADAKKVSTRAEVDLFGLKIVPDVGSTLIIDPSKLTISTIGQVRVLVRSELTGEIVLWHGSLQRDLSAVKPGTTLFDFPIGEYAPKILGFPVGADIAVRLEKDSVHIPMSLKLPPAFFGASASTEIVADRATGVHLDSLHLHLGPVPLGAIVLDKFDLIYKGGEELWQGDGQLTIAGAGSIEAGATFRMGGFDGGKIVFSPQQPVPIGPFVYLLRAGGGFNIDPLHIEIDASVGGGVAAAGKSPVRVDGTATADFPHTGPGRFQIDGTVSLFGITAGSGRLRYQTDGYADFNLEAHADFAILSLNGSLEGFVDGTTGQAAAAFEGKACVNFGVGCLVGAGLQGAVSSSGLALCGGAEINVPGLDPKDKISGSIGVQFTLEGLKDAGETLAATPGILVPAVGAGIVAAHLHIPCHTTDFRKPPPRPRAALRAAGAGPVVDVGGGLPTKTVMVTGADALPDVDLVGPGGTVAGPSAGERGHTSAAGSAIALPDAKTVIFVLKAPKAGAWTVTPRAGSPAVADVQVSDGYQPARATGRVQTLRGKRSLRYTVRDAGAGQQVRFVEAGAFGTRVLGTATRPAGTLPLPAGTLTGGPRTITAEVLRGGVVTDHAVVARYVAPPAPRPGPVGGLKVLRRGSTLTVTWRRPALGAARQLVRLKGAKGTSLVALVGPRARLARFSRVRFDERVTVEVSGLTKTMSGGPVRRAVSRGVIAKAPAPKRKPKRRP